MEGRITDKQAALLKKRGVTVDYDMSKQSASDLIDQILSSPKGKIVTSTNPEIQLVSGNKYQPRNYGSQGPMWGRYAVDLLIAMIGVQKEAVLAGMVKEKEQIQVDKLAAEAIQIVLSMRSQFKE